MNDLFNMFLDLDAVTNTKELRTATLRAPFAYAGGKSKNRNKILPHLPYRSKYIEPFGGSAAVMLGRQPSDLEVYNDRYAGVVAFYRCIRDKDKVIQLIDRLTDIVHSREEFVWCASTWVNCTDDVERAARWWYMSSTSFGSIGRNFGRSLKTSNQIAIKMHRKVLEFDRLHQRFKNVIIENQDWSQILDDYDCQDSVFYLDPPYLTAYKGTYRYEMSYEDHSKLIKKIFDLKGFVALSGYSCELYDNQPWDSIETWDSTLSITPMAFYDENKKSEKENHRDIAQEKLYIKR